MALPGGAVGWSAVCECDIFRSYSLTFCTCNKGKPRIHGLNTDNSQSVAFSSFPNQHSNEQINKFVLEK